MSQSSGFGFHDDVDGEVAVIIIMEWPQMGMDSVNQAALPS